ncbi:MAG: hypothetical protein ABSB67_21540 [Bryobacteraceae bacterium]
MDSVDQFKQATERKLPRLRFDGSSLRDITINISGCCQKLMSLANIAIAQPR